jgi:hypothetical protein
MADDASLPNWARNRRTLLSVILAAGAGLTALLVGAALLAPSALRSVMEAFDPFPLLGLAAALFVVGGVRRLVLGPAREQEAPPGPVLVTYLLATLSSLVAVLSLSLLVTLALIFQWQPRFSLVQSLVLLLLGFAVFSMTMKTLLNGQMLARHWLGG